VTTAPVRTRHALVTGASTGIGRACAVRLAGDGWRVFAGVRSDADGEEVRAAVSGTIVPLRLDVTDADEVARAASVVAEAVGAHGLHAVVNNAGIAIGGAVETTSLDDWRRVLEVNLLGQLAVTQATLDLVRAARGRYVFVGSANGRVSGPLLGPYAASKHALEAACESLRHELRPSGVTVTCVEPGAVRTPIWPKVRREVDDVAAAMGDAASARYAPMVDAVRRLADDAEAHGVTAERVAEVVASVLAARRPPARRLVGADAWAIGAAARLLPDGLRDRLVRAQLGLGWR
jgi:NAD(P)-dependent dehydrogenase (short-subunit alcohol dehydrogenase family)